MAQKRRWQYDVLLEVKLPALRSQERVVQGSPNILTCEAHMRALQVAGHITKMLRLLSVTPKRLLKISLYLEYDHKPSWLILETEKKYPY
jgi:hypothetical protein